MNADSLIAQLQANASEKYRKNVVRLGIPESCSIGVPTSFIRKTAKTTPRSIHATNVTTSRKLQ